MNRSNLDTNYMWDNSGNNLGWLASDTGGPPESCGGSTIGYTVSKKTLPYLSIITICEPAIGNGQTLTDISTTEYALNEINLDDIVEPSLTALLIHELTHAWSIMNGLQYATGTYEPFSLQL